MVGTVPKKTPFPTIMALVAIVGGRVARFSLWILSKLMNFCATIEEDICISLYIEGRYSSKAGGILPNVVFFYCKVE